MSQDLSNFFDLSSDEDGNSNLGISNVEKTKDDGNDSAASLMASIDCLLNADAHSKKAADMDGLEINAKILADKNWSMYLLRMRQNIATKLEQAQRAHKTLAEELRQLTEEGRKLKEMIRLTRAGLMIESDYRYW